MSEGKIFHLTLNKKWFDMIASGEKKEEYREIKPYWINRLTWHEHHSEVKCLESLLCALEYDSERGWLSDGVFKTNIDIISANNGYSKGCPNIKWKHEGIAIGEGKPEWGAKLGVKYFILKVGEIFT